MTSNIDLKQMARKNGIHVDIFARDDLPYLQNRKRKNNLIINLDKVNGKGTHWTALHINQPNATYFDSFGMPPPTNILEYWKDFHLTIKKERIQALN